MKYFVTEFSFSAPRNKAVEEFIHRVPNYLHTLLPDKESVEKMESSIKALAERINEAHTTCRPITIKCCQFIDGDIVMDIHIPTGQRRIDVGWMRLVKVSHEWKEGGIK